MSDSASDSSIGLLLLTLGVAGSSFFWLLVQTATRRRTGWMAAVVTPGILAGYTIFAILPEMANAFRPEGWQYFLLLAAAIGGGFLFERRSWVSRNHAELEGRHAPWPMLLWGTGMLLFIAAPAGNSVQVGQATLEAWSAALGFMGAFSLIGQALSKLTLSPVSVGKTPAPPAPSKKTLNEISATYLRGDLEQSRAQLLVFLRENPSDALAWVVLGNIHEDLNEDQQAERAYRKAIELNPQTYQAYSGLGVLCRKKGDYDGAMTHYNEALSISPNYAQAYSSMAIIELKRYRDQSALELAQKAYELDRRDPVVAANLSLACHFNNRSADRDRMYQECRRLGYRNMDGLDRIFRGELTVRD